MANRFKIRRGSVAPNNSADIENYELVYNYTNNELWTKHNGSVVKIASGATGTVTNVVAGNGLTGGGTSTATLDLDFSQLTDLTSDISGSTEFILQDGTTESRKAASEIKLSAFNNDLSLSSGTVTSVTAGTGATHSGTNTVNPTINVVGENGLVASANAIGLDISTLAALQVNNLADEDLFALEVAVGGAIKKIPASDLKTYINSSLSASAITSGTFATARIPNLAASKITSGTFSLARIPSTVFKENIGTLSGGNTTENAKATGLYQVSETGHSTLLASFTGIGGSTRSLELYAHYNDELYFRTGRDSETNFDSVGRYDNKIFHSNNSTSITSVGTIGTGTWQGTAIASAYLDADTAHLSGTQTFSGAKTFTGRLTISDAGADGLHLNQDTGTTTNSNRIFFTGNSGSCIMQEFNDLSFRTGATVGSSSGTERFFINSSGPQVPTGSQLYVDDIYGQSNGTNRLVLDDDTQSGIANGVSLTGVNHIYICADETNNGTGAIKFRKGTDNDLDSGTSVQLAEISNTGVLTVNGGTIDIPNTGDWSFIKNNTNSGGLRFGTKDSGGNYANQIEISNTGNYVKLNENTTVTGTMSVSSIFYGSQIDLTSELNFTGAGNKIIDVETLAGSNSLTIRHHNPSGNLFEDALKLTANAGAKLYYNNGLRLETTDAGASVTGVLTSNNRITSTGNGGFTIGNYAGYDRIQNSSNNFSFLTDGNAYANMNFGTVSNGTWQGTAIANAYIADNAINAAKLNVSGDGTNGQVLKSDGDGTFSWFSLVSSSNAGTLDNLDSTQFLRSDATSGTITSQDWNTYINGTEVHFSSVTNHSGSNRPTGAYTYGVALSYSVASGGKFQLYAPEKATAGDSTNQGLWYRSGWNTTYRQWAQIWDSTNDGSGSGLDADTVDGIQASSFLRSDANDTASGQYNFTKVNDHAIKVGTIRGTVVGSQSGEYIQMYNRVHIGSPSGWGSRSAPNYGLSVYGGVDLATDTGSVTISGNTAWHAGNDGSGSGLDADTLDGYDSSRFFRRQGSASATVGPGWITVATNTSGRKAGEILVTDSESGDHGFIRIHWLRSFVDSNFTVINCGGHSNRITGVRVLSQDNAGNNEHVYGEKILQVYVTVSSNYHVKIFRMGDDPNYLDHTVHTPTVENTISGYSLHGNQLEDLNTYGFAHEEGIQAGGVIKTQSNMEAVNITASGKLTTERIDITESGTVIGDIQSTDSTWLRLNHSTNKNIYTPRYIRADNGFFVDGSSQGITGDAIFRAPNGSSGTPSISFANDTNTGIYRYGADQLGFATGGAHRGFINSDGNWYNFANFIATTNGAGYLGRDTGGTVTGLIKASTSNFVEVGSALALKFVTNGSSRYQIDTSGNHSIYGNTGFSSPMSVEYGAIFNEGGHDSDTRIESDGNANMFRVDASTNRIGIGTGSPTKTLHVEGSTRLNGDTIVGPNNNNSKAFIRANNGYSTQDNPDYTFYYDDKTGISHPAGSVIGFNTGQVERLRITNQGITFSQNGSAAAPSMSWTSDPDLGFYRNGANNMRFSAGNAIRGTWNGDGLVLNGGSLGVNVAIPTTDGVIRAGNDVIAFYSSDERLKENVKPIENALDKVSSIRGVEFDWIVDKEIHANKGHDVGVIAQEIEKVLPEVVETRDNGYKAVKYEKIVSLLIEAVKQQQVQIDELKTKLGE